MSSIAQTGLTLVTASGFEGVSVYTDDGNVALTGGTPFAGIHSRTMFFQDQAGGTTVVGSWGQLKYYSGVDIGPARVAAVEGYNELLTTNIVKSGGALDCVRAEMDGVAGTFTVNSGGVATGFHANMTGAATFTMDGGGILAGLKVGTTATTGVWGYGVYIAAGAATTGIYIGNTTTGIAFAGTIGTSGLSFSGATFPVASDNVSLINIGTYDAGISSAASSDNTFAVVNNRISTADDAYWFMNEYMKISMTTADQTNKSFVNLGIRQAITKPVASTYGIQSHLTFSATGDVASEIIPLSAQTAGTAATGSGLHWGVKSDLRAINTPSGAGHQSACFFGVGTVSCSTGLYLESLGSTTMYSGVYLHAAGNITNAVEIGGAANMTNLFKFDAASGPVSVDAGNTGDASTHKIKVDIGGVAGYIAVFADY